MRKEELPDYLFKTIEYMGGKGNIVEICRCFWSLYEGDIKPSEDLFYTWQYDIRWAATELRKTNRMKGVDISPRGIWEIK